MNNSASPAENSGGVVQARYSYNETHRRPFLDRARACAKLTVPSLLPPEGHNSSADLLSPRQSLGARGLNNMAAKLTLALLPPNSPFFKHVLSDNEMEKLGAAPEQRAGVDRALGKIEREIMAEIEVRAMRPAIHEALKLLALTGNVLIYMPKKGPIRYFKLDSYVVERDAEGNVLRIITKESVSPELLPDEIVHTQVPMLTASDKSVDVYTEIARDGKTWGVHQEALGQTIPGSEGSHPDGKLPWLPLRWATISGEDYGRGYFEEYYGDLKSLEGLTDSILKGAAVAARVIPMVRPNGSTDIDTLAEAEDGEFVDGEPDDVGFLQVDKFGDFRVAREMVDEIRRELSMAFMLNSSIQRSGERVTAEEIRFMAGELEDALGGVYSLLAQELQLPLVTLIQSQLEAQGKLPRLPKNAVRPTITTGLEALGRGHDLNKLDTFLAGLQSALGPEVTAQYLNVSDYITRRATSLGIDTAGLVRSEEEVQQQQQAAQMQALMQQLGPNAVNQLGGMAQKQMEGQPDG